VRAVVAGGLAGLVVGRVGVRRRWRGRRLCEGCHPTQRIDGRIWLVVYANPARSGLPRRGFESFAGIVTEADGVGRTKLRWLDWICGVATGLGIGLLTSWHGVLSFDGF
jgi:hypothetical protein